MCRPCAVCWCAATPCSRVGGLEAEFRGLYEDQVLYVKAGLQLTAVIDPRPLALYRQHPGVGVRGRRSPTVRGAGEGPSPPPTRFFTWMRSYVRAATGPRSEESEIVERNVDHNRTHPDRARSGGRVACFADATPEPLRPRSAVGAAGGAPYRQHQSPASVVGEWSAQHLRVITASLAGSVLVIVPDPCLG